MLLLKKNGQLVEQMEFNDVFVAINLLYWSDLFIAFSLLPKAVVDVDVHGSHPAIAFFDGVQMVLHLIIEKALALIFLHEVVVEVLEDIGVLLV